MKKTLASFISFSMLMGSLFTLASCGGTKLPATKYEKVEFALNGVESSFRDAMNSKRKVEPLKQERFNDGGSSESLNTIFGLFTEGDYRGSNLDEELTYGEPPMAQFQCVKKALEKIGSNFSFGTKYFDDVTGSAYIDFETGFKAETKPEFKYDYTFTLGLELNIDDNDFITADVSFDIALAKDGKTYAVNWYVGMDLTYDMTKTEPTYKLLMITENDEVALPYFNRYVYEYDYVDTNNNKINEWRKFVLETNEKLYKDATHQDFSSYMNKEGFIFQAETCAWYKNSKLYKFTERKHDREVTFASELFANIGLNSTVINCGPFINKAGTRNSVIKDLYAEFSRIRGDDLIYDLVCRDDDDGGHEEEKKPSHIALMDGTHTQYIINERVKDMLFSALLTGYINAEGTKRAVQLCYTDENNMYMKDVEDITSLHYEFALYGNESEFKNTIVINIRGDLISTAYNNFIEQYGSDYSDDFKLTFKDTTLNIGGETYFTYVKGQNEPFPEELIHLGLPEYPDTNARYSYSKVNDEYHLDIAESSTSYADEYHTLIQKAGFVVDEENSYKGVSYRYTKGFGDRRYLEVYFHYNSEFSFSLNIAIREEQGGNDSSEEDTSTEETIDIYNVAIVGSWNGWDVDAAEDMYPMEEGRYQAQLRVVADMEFKVVVNRSWYDGGYGYKSITNANKYSKYIECEEEHGNIRIKVLGDLHLIAEIKDAGGEHPYISLIINSFEPLG